jgi:hypothetical protein
VQSAYRPQLARETGGQRHERGDYMQWDYSLASPEVERVYERLEKKATQALARGCLRRRHLVRSARASAP